MPRLLLFLLLSLTLHATAGLLLRESMASKGAQARQNGQPLVVQYVVEVPAPISSVAPAPAEPAQSRSSRRRPEAVASAGRPAKPSRAQPVARATAKPLATPMAHPAQTPTGTAGKPPPGVASAMASQAAPAMPQRVAEVLSRQPKFSSPPRQPRYPAQARRRNQQGVVLVEVRLDERGSQREIRVLRSSGVESLDRAALEAVAHWQFHPETREGVGVPSRVQIPIEFALMASR